MRSIALLAVLGLGCAVDDDDDDPGESEVEQLQGSECALTGRICAWTLANRQGSYGAWATQVTNFGAYGFHDSIRSLWNRYSQPWIFYESENFHGRAFCLLSGHAMNDLRGIAIGSGNGDWWWIADSIDSARRTASCPAGMSRF